MHSGGNTAVKGWSWPNFWANLAYFSAQPVASDTSRRVRRVRVVRRREGFRLGVHPRPPLRHEPHHEERGDEEEVAAEVRADVAHAVCRRGHAVRLPAGKGVSGLADCRVLSFWVGTRVG